MDKRNLVGRKFGRLTVICDSGNRKWQCVWWKCLCDCGNYLEVITASLNNGHTTSCGCYKRDQTIKRNKKLKTIHGHSGQYNTASPTYNSWYAMKQRCHYKKHKDFHRYGGKGIFVCRRWRVSFENFLKDMGERPKGQTINRLSNSLGYGPWNCNWATPHEQNVNSALCKLDNDKVIEIRKLLNDGMNIKNVAKKFNISDSHIKHIEYYDYWKDV